MSPGIQYFIELNIHLIDADTKESWEEFYEKLLAYERGIITTILLDAGIDPAYMLRYIPHNYLYESEITSYVVPDTVTHIDDCAFDTCYKLRYFEVGPNVDTLGKRLFYSCNKLKEIVFKGKKNNCIFNDPEDDSWWEGSSIERIICEDGVVEL